MKQLEKTKKLYEFILKTISTYTSLQSKTYSDNDLTLTPSCPKAFLRSLVMKVSKDN